MLKVSFSLLFCSVILVCINSMPAPQDFQTTAILAAGQAKEILDNGAAARDSKKFAFMGAEIKNDFELGFGDAVKPKTKRAAYSPEQVAEVANKRPKRKIDRSSSSASSSSSSSSSESDSEAN